MSYCDENGCQNRKRHPVGTGEITVLYNEGKFTEAYQEDLETFDKLVKEHLESVRVIVKFNNGGCKNGCNCVEVAEAKNQGEPVKNYRCLGDTRHCETLEERLRRHTKEDPIVVSKAVKKLTEEEVDHLTWIYGRLITHGEDTNVDYMVKFSEIVDKLRNF